MNWWDRWVTSNMGLEAGPDSSLLSEPHPLVWEAWEKKITNHITGGSFLKFCVRQNQWEGVNQSSPGRKNKSLAIDSGEP